MFVKKLSGAITVLGLMLFIVLALSTSSVKAQSPYPLNSFFMDPSAVSFNTNNANVGTKFNVTVWAYLADNSYAWEFNMIFDPTILQATAAGYTAVGTSQFFAGHSTAPTPAQLDNTAGTVLIGESLLGSDSRLSNNASLAWVTFQITQAPTVNVTSLTSALGINNTDTYALNTDLHHFLTTDFDGTYTFTYVTPVPLSIPSVTQVPDKTSVGDGQSVAVSANVTGGTGGVANVTLSYSTDNSTFTNVTMTLSGTTGLWGGTIPGNTAGTTVYYKIIAYDTAGNSKISDTGQWYYTIIPEFTSVLMIVMLIAAASAVLLMRKKIMR